jgi:hypothetical protein
MQSGEVQKCCMLSLGCGVSFKFEELTALTMRLIHFIIVSLSWNLNSFNYFVYFIMFFFHISKFYWLFCLLGFHSRFDG